jgi:hypothetical protein
LINWLSDDDSAVVPDFILLFIGFLSLNNYSNLRRQDRATNCVIRNFLADRLIRKDIKYGYFATVPQILGNAVIDAVITHIG